MLFRTDFSTVATASRNSAVISSFRAPVTPTRNDNGGRRSTLAVVDTIGGLPGGSLTFRRRITTLALSLCTIKQNLLLYLQFWPYGDGQPITDLVRGIMHHSGFFEMLDTSENCLDVYANRSGNI